MKKLFTFVLLWAACSTLAIAQRQVERSLKWQPEQMINLELKHGYMIRVEGWDKNEVKFEASVNINDNTANEAFLIETKSWDEALMISTKLDQDKLQNVENNCEGNSVISVHNSTYRTCLEIDYVIYIPRQATLEVKTISGNIELNGLSGPVYAKSISGFVDLDWPAASGAEVAMKSISGEVFSNLPVDFSNRKEDMPNVGYKLKGELAGGGEKLHLESVSGNVYLRERKN